MTILQPEALQERARKLDTAIPSFNGMRMVLVSALDVPNQQASLDIHFFNQNYLEAMATAAGSAALFPISGGHRILAGPATGQIQVTAVDHPDTGQAILRLTVKPIGDYSTYTLSINTQNHSGIQIDPLFSEIDFKFRPGCFSIDCAPEWEPAPAPQDNPTIDYLAKDYESFKHTLIAAMMQRVPGWQPSSEADLDQVLLELFCVAADELSDYQDRVMNEAYLNTARKRVSLARHARLMDYHIHQGNQSSTWLAVKLGSGKRLEIPKSEATNCQLTTWAGSATQDEASAVVFMTRLSQTQHMDWRLNQLGLYTWEDAIPALAAGSTSADLQVLEEDSDSPSGYSPINEKSVATSVQELIQTGAIQYLLIQEWLNPATGHEAGRNPEKRQLLKLLTNAEALQDPLTEAWFVRVKWVAQDALKASYCFTVDCADGKREYVSLFHGNLVPVFRGRPTNAVFKDPQETLTLPEEFHYERTEKWGTICRLPAGPLAYQNTPVGGEVPPQSTLTVKLGTDLWDEAISLVHCDTSAEGGDRFVVETDEAGQSLLRFGNGINGQALPEGATVSCTYQVGWGPEGNIGADQLIYFDAEQYPEIAECWNPFDVTNGREPEAVAEIIRRAPEAYRVRQLRAITLQDYINRAEEVEGVSRAAARYAWTGSWRTVQMAIDPVGTTELTPTLRQKVACHLESVRLIGEDLEIRSPRYVPLDIAITFCIHPDYWPEDVRFFLEQELSEGYTPDGRLGFFHPERWTFGQPLHASEIIGRIHLIEGVEHVLSVTMKRWNAPSSEVSDTVSVRVNEIIRVRNNPDHMEDGFITFDPQGGRQ